MPRHLIPHTMLVLVVLLTGFALDQLTKLWALNSLANGEVIPILPTVSLRLAFNPGAAFGLGAASGPVLAIGILALLLVLTGWIISRLLRGSPLLGTLLLTAVAAGGWGNMSDRLTRGDGQFLSGHVVDFVAVDWFAIFNLGDVLTVIGMALWALTLVSVRSGEPAIVAYESSAS
ncbi:hypothetical protein ASF62_12020 [Leifsonia sp. Leaf325]|nr:hypothetical protein ASF62_12020 [Leifsonia sp. Leaf325]